jgi:hypothetical protein
MDQEPHFDLGFSIVMSVVMAIAFGALGGSIWEWLYL